MFPEFEKIAASASPAPRSSPLISVSIRLKEGLHAKYAHTPYLCKSQTFMACHGAKRIVLVARQYLIALLLTEHIPEL